ncbi:MAG: hypothetical protein FWC47_17060, partial [Oscillospiraceae bacterium]|nr:hypothetical protein [Oscillospiraceae bacterium]
MSKPSKFLGFFKAMLHNNFEEKDNLPLDNPKSSNINNINLMDKKIPKKTTSLDYNPLRKLLCWGYDKYNNPSFLIFYGNHKFKKTNSNGNEFEDDVAYTDYAVFHGKEGHFPSFESIRILYNSKDSSKKMFYKKDSPTYYWYNRDEGKALKNFKSLKNNSISIPYFTSLIYKDHIDIILSKNIHFDDFTLVDNPLDMLKLSDDLVEY